MWISKHAVKVLVVLGAAIVIGPMMVGDLTPALSAPQEPSHPAEASDQTTPVRLEAEPWEPEVARGRQAPAHILAQRATSAGTVVSVGPYVSRQVSLDPFGDNVIGDAANEPSMAIDPTDPNKIVIGWRQFDTIFDLVDAFREAGYAYSIDGGLSWTASVIENGTFRSDPVLGSDAAGNFYYSSLSSLTSIEVFKSTTGGSTWSAPVSAFGGDKQWMTVDATAGIGSGHIYQNWNVQFTCCFNSDFTRSVDGGASFESPIGIRLPKMKWGTLNVGPDGDLYLAGVYLDQVTHVVARSSDAQNSAMTPSFDLIHDVDLGGTAGRGGINPQGLTGQVWVATDHSTTATRGNVYVLASVNPPGDDPLDVHFIRSTDRGQSWSTPVRVNDDGATNAWQWFGAISVAPNGRIDVTWNDTRNDAGENTWSEVFYSFSLDAGQTWSTNIPISPSFDPRLGYPANGISFQNKMGDYTHMISDNGGASLAYTATHNGGEDVYYLRIPTDCDNNGTSDADELTGGATDCNGNAVPDNCEPDEDCNDNGTRDICEIAGGAPDCNQNRVPDICEPDLDCNTNGIQDICDITDGTSRDENGNGIPDDCEVKFSQPPDETGEDIVSNIDLASFDFNAVVADDFVSDGRPITGVRWWGSHLSPPSVAGSAVTTAANGSHEEEIYHSMTGGSFGADVERLASMHAPPGALSAGSPISLVGFHGYAEKPRRSAKSTIDKLAHQRPWNQAVAAAPDKMYFGDSGIKKIQRADLDGTNVIDLVTFANVSPQSLALDLDGGKMYWTEGWFNKIQRSNLDGSNVEDLVTTNLPAPNGIALDLSAGKMYWADSSNKSIRRTDLDGSNLEVLATSAEGLDAPHAIALDVSGGKIYWTDRNTHKIHRADLDGSNVEAVFTEVGGDNDFGLALDIAAGKMYWTNAQADKIRRADLDGSNLEDLVTTGLSFPGDIALDIAAGKMYWTDWGNDTIKRANLDGTSVESLITAGLVTPKALALGVAGAAPPSGEDCDDAIEIVALPYTTTGETCAYNDDYDELCPSDTPGSADVVYKYTPSSSAYVKISLCENSDYDTKHYVYENACGAYQSGTAIACSDDTCQSPLNPWVSHISAVFMAAGNTYYIVIDGWGGDCGNYTLDVRETGPPPPDPSCSTDAMVAQPASTPDGWWSMWFSDEDYGWRSYDTFAGVTERITHAKWWGVELFWNGSAWVPCDDPSPSFRVNFYEDIGGAAPGPLACSFTVVPSRAYTGHEYFTSNGIWNLLEYEADLNPGCALSSGWVSIEALNGDPTCFFGWMGSAAGDISSLQEEVFSGDVYYRNPDRAVCLSGTGPRPDGWLISFHKPLSTGGSADPPLGLYFCDSSAVTQEPTALGACDGEIVVEYEASLIDCCIIHSNLDTRSDWTPALFGGFYEEECFAYDIDIQAVTGKTFFDDGFGNCVEASTDTIAFDDFWGWHTTDEEQGAAFGLHSALTSFITMPDSSTWLYGPWSNVTPACSQANMAYELLTTTPPPFDPDRDESGVPDRCELGPVVFVDSQSPGGTVAAAIHDGASWDTAFLYLQDALDTARVVSGVTQIWVAAGIHTPDTGGFMEAGDRLATFELVNGVAIYGGFPSAILAPDPTERDELSDRNPELYETQLSGDLFGDDIPAEFPDGASYADNSFHVITGDGTTALLDSLTVSGGNANGESFPEDRAGGLRADSGACTINNCTFRNNYGLNEAGAIRGLGSTLTITRCQFVENATSGGGAGISSAGGVVTITNSEFRRNAASTGAGLHASSEADVALTNCVFANNVSGAGGAGIFVFSGTQLLVNNCTFAGNTTTFTIPGGTLLVSQATTTGTVTNSIFWENSAISGSSFNEDDQLSILAGATLNVDYSLVQGLTGALGGMGNIDANPVFESRLGADGIAGTGDEDWRLASNSPAIDAADTSAIPADVTDLDDDADTAERTPIDLAGMPRVMDNPETPDTGVAGSAVVDMGPYEFVPDCNNNNIPDPCDLSCLALGGDCGLFPCEGGLDTCVSASTSGPSSTVLGDTTGDDIVVGGSSSVAGIAGVVLAIDKDDTWASLTVRSGSKVNFTNPTSVGNITITGPGGFLLEGETDIDSEHSIDLGNMEDLIVGPGGWLRVGISTVASSRGGAAALPISTSVRAHDIVIRPDTCGATGCKDGGIIEITDSRIEVFGDIILEGSPDSASVVAGGQTPPALRLWPSAFAAIAGRETSSAGGLLGARVEVGGSFRFSFKVDTINESLEGMILNEDFDNKSTCPVCFDWSQGTLTQRRAATAANAAGLPSFQKYEVAGKEEGVGGFRSFPDTNFVIGKYNVQAATAATAGALCGVRFVNEFANTVGDGPCEEAAYFNNCVFDAGCQITLEDVNVYCGSLQAAGATINENGCGTLQVVNAAPDALLAGPNPFAVAGGGDLNRAGGLAMPVSAGGQEVAIRITLTNLYIDSDVDPINGCPVRTGLSDLTVFNGQVRYLGPPSAFDDNDLATTPKFVAAELQCTPFYRDWSPAALTADFGAGVNTDTIYYYGAEVLPCSVYGAQQGTQTCVESANEGCFSEALEIRTALWGDVWPAFGDINFTDIGKIVDAFKGIAFVEGNPPDGAPRKVRAMLRENSAPFDSAINFTDIGKVVDAFKTIAYQEDGPTACP